MNEWMNECFLKMTHFQVSVRCKLYTVQPGLGLEKNLLARQPSNFNKSTHPTVNILAQIKKHDTIVYSDKKKKQ